MTDDERLAYDILQSFDVAVLRRTGPGTYSVFGRVPAFYAAMFPSVDGVPCGRPWDVSPMLEFFLVEAEQFFEEGGTGAIDSGIWIEDGLPEKNTALKAVATALGNDRIIVISLLKEEYVKRASTLQIAREQLLENRRLSTNLTIFKEKSRIDGLTCIFNKTTFQELLIDELKRCQIMEYPVSLLMLDIDNFKTVNDTYGHLTGDRILQGIGVTLKSILRRNDIVGRYGGEEFVVIISNAPLDQAVQVAEKIRVTLSSMSISDAPRFTVSIGCTAYKPGESAEEFFARTDGALYDAKKTGKDRVCVH